MTLKAVDIAEIRRAPNMTGPMPSAVRFVTAQDAVAIDDSSRTASFIFSDESVDRYGDVIKAQGWRLDNFAKNPVALFGHDAASVENVVGRAKNVRVEGKRLVGDIEFMGADVNPNADAVFRMVKGGFLKTVSVGFAPLDWEPAKDKSRPGGVDFKAQELLEISIVPIPANPNAVSLAKAAGIDVARLGLAAPEATATVAETRAPPKIVRKGLGYVSWLAGILGELGYLSDAVAQEAAHEGDGSTVPAELLAALQSLGAVLVAMTQEEVAELLAGEDDDDNSMSIGLEAPAPLAAIAQALGKMTPAAQLGLATVARDLAAGRVVHVKTADAKTFEPLIKAGKPISAANEKKLRDAHAHAASVQECIMAVIAPPDTSDGDADDAPAKAAAETAERERKARALKRKADLAS